MNNPWQKQTKETSQSSTPAPIQAPQPEVEVDTEKSNTPDFTPRFEYPPTHIIFPPPADLYVLGTIDMQEVARRLIEARGRVKHFLPAPSSHEVNEAIICAALGLPDYSPITLEMLQTLWYALAYEPKANDGSDDRYQFWPYSILHLAVAYRAHTKFGYGTLKDPPLNPSDKSPMARLKRELAGRV